MGLNSLGMFYVKQMWAANKHGTGLRLQMISSAFYIEKGLVIIQLAKIIHELAWRNQWEGNLSRTYYSENMLIMNTHI